MWFVDISPSLKLVLHSLSSLTHLAGTYFDDILFITFHFVDNVSYIRSKNSSPDRNHYDWPLYFFLKVLCLVFGSITHLDWCSAYGMMLRVIFVYLDLWCFSAIHGGDGQVSVELPLPLCHVLHTQFCSWLPTRSLEHRSLCMRVALPTSPTMPWLLQLYDKPSNWGLWAVQTSVSELFWLPNSFAFLSKYILEAVCLEL